MMRGHKYGARRTAYNGVLYDSKAEAEYAAHLDHLKAAGQIDWWERGPDIVLVPGRHRKDRIVFRPDFRVAEPGDFGVQHIYYVDVKGVLTPVFRLKWRLWRALRDDELRVIDTNGQQVQP